MTRYHDLADEVSSRIHDGVLRPGDRLPSVREVSRSRRLSPATAVRAYQLLEDRGEVTSRARSGYYVKAKLTNATLEPLRTNPAFTPGTVHVNDLLLDLLRTNQKRDIARLGSAFMGPQLFPLSKLARFLHSAAKMADPEMIYQQMPPGNPDLRRLIARRYLDTGCDVSTEEIVITSGGIEAINLCLHAVTKPGDLVAIECPAFYLFLEAIQRLGLKAIQIPMHCRDGLGLNALSDALKTHPIKACLMMTTFQNPLGSLMPVGNKQALVKLLQSHDVPLIEDDAYAELYFGEERPIPAKAFDSDGLVMHCSSFSKSLAPGYKVGWVAPGRFIKKVLRSKLTTSVATSGPPQIAIAEFLKRGGYNNHLRKLRRVLEDQQSRMLQSIGHHFPPGTCVTRPRGGYFLWLQLPAGVDVMKVYGLAKQKNITFAPGPLFSPNNEFGNCMRLNYGRHRSVRPEAAISTLGMLIAAQL